MTRAVERYRTNTPWLTPCPITPIFDIQTGGILSSGCAGVAPIAAGTAATGAAPAGTGVGIGPR